MSFFSSFATDREFWSKVRNIILPISLQQLLFHAGAATDAVMLTNWGQNALAGVSLAGQYQFIFGLIMSSCNYSLAIFVSQYWGKRDTRTIARLLGMSVQINLLLAMIFYPAAVLCPRAVMNALTNSPELVKTGSVYLRWVSLSYFLMAVTQGMTTVCTSTGYARRILYITCSTVVLDVIFNALFIFGIGGYMCWGVKGAAAATVTVRMIGAVLTGWELHREGNIHCKAIYFTRFASVLFLKIAKYTIPIFGNVCLYGFGLVTGAVIIGHMGANAVAANSLTLVAKNIFSCFFTGIGGGASVIAGNALGSGNLARCRDLGNKLLFFALLAGCAAACLMPCALPFFSHFSKLNAETMHFLTWMTLLSTPYLICKACNIVFFKLMNTGGDCKFTFWCDFITIAVLVIPIGFMAAFVIRVPVLVVFVIVYADEIIKCVPALYHYRKYHWVRDLTKRHISNNQCCKNQ